MTLENNGSSRFAPFTDDEFDRDPMERIAHYEYGDMEIFRNGRSSGDDVYSYSAAERRSVAEALARMMELYILTSAETNFRGELTFKVRLPPPTKNPGFVGWENGPSW